MNDTYQEALDAWKGRHVCNCRRYAKIDYDTGWWNQRFDCSDRPEFHNDIPDGCWFDQAIFGALLVPVVAWANGDGTFACAPKAGAWPTGDDLVRAKDCTTSGVTHR